MDILTNTIMRTAIILIFLVVIQFEGFSQFDFTKVHISKDIELIKLSENAYVHVSYSSLPNFGRFPSNGLVFINGGEAFLFDTPVTDSLTKDLVSWITDSMNVKIVGFVPNHWHEDCMGGLSYLQDQNIVSYANQMTKEIATAKNLPVPTVGFTDSLQLQLGNKLVACHYFGAAHSIDNIVVWIPSEQVLFAGCMIKSAHSKDLGNTVDGDLTAYPKTIDKLIERLTNAKFVIPGHGQVGGIELIKHTKELTAK
jgi:metallo-beta-lactamase class B